MRDVDVVIVGAGVVGLAIAAEIARVGRSVVILEEDGGIARGVTSRNSEVIHAGIYYPAGSLKARLCVRGRELLYDYCVRHRVDHRKTGKLIVAAREAERSTLEDLKRRAEANGVPGLAWLEPDEVSRLEPAVRCSGALHSPETGIVDGHGLCLSLLAEAEAHGATLLLGHRVVGLEAGVGSWSVAASAGDGASADVQTVTCGAVVNAAGLAGDRVASLAGLDVDQQGLRLHYCKGDYFSLAPSAPVSLTRLVYPVPVEAGLGIHATVDLAGRIRFGPDTEYVSGVDWTVDPAKAARFADAIRRYLPAVEESWLTPDYAGIRPKLAGPGEGFADFVVREESAAGCQGLVDCVGIESPGLTAALAIGEHVARLV